MKCGFGKRGIFGKSLTSKRKEDSLRKLKWLKKGNIFYFPGWRDRF